jgi:hypothetical protein
MFTTLILQYIHITSYALFGFILIVTVLNVSASLNSSSGSSTPRFKAYNITDCNSNSYYMAVFIQPM